MKHARILLLLGLLVVSTGLALTAHKLPYALGSRFAATTTDSTSSFAENLLSRAEAGDAPAQYSVGVQYATGAFDREQNDAEARRWYEMAAEQGLLRAQIALAEAFESDYTKTKDEEARSEAEKWLYKAAEQGDPKAQYQLGCSIIYRYSTSSEKEIEVGMNWLRSAAESGFVDAQVRLADQLNHAAREEKNFDLELAAMNWYQKAAEQGHAEAQLTAAHFFQWGYFHNPSTKHRDAAKAIRYYKMAASRGQIDGLYRLAIMYELGTGVAQDKAEAAKWWLELLNLETDGFYAGLAYGSLGRMRAEGVGLPQDLIEAHKWYNLAATVKNPVRDLLRDVSEATNPAYIAERDRIATLLSPNQITEAQRRATAFRATRESGHRQTEQEPKPTRAEDLTATGSGFFVHEDGYLLTSYHVVAGARRIVAKTTRGQLAARMLKADPATDLAILKVEGRFASLPIATQGSPQLGAPVFTIGYPNTSIQGVEPKLTRGEVNSLSGIQDDPVHYQISVPVQPGNSGGPLIDLCGNVVGIVRSRLDETATLEITGSLPQNVNYAVKSSYIASLLHSMPSLATKLKKPHPARERNFQDVVKEAQEAAVLVLVY